MFSAEIQRCTHACISETTEPIFIIFRPSCAEIQYEQIGTSRIIFRRLCAYRGWQNYSVPKSAMLLHNARQRQFCCCLQRRWRKMSKIACSSIYADPYLERYWRDRREIFTTVLRDSRRKKRYVARNRAMRGTCTRSTRAECAVFRENQTPCISVLKREFFSKKGRFGPRAPLYSVKPLWFGRFVPEPSDWNSLEESDYVG